MSADLVLFNGKIHTLDAKHPTASAVAIRDGRILAVGNDAEMRELAVKNHALVDLEGRGAVPGLVDAHVHFQWFSLNLTRLDLFEVPSLAEALRRVEQAGREISSDRWLLGRGWNQDLWVERAFPTAADLDRVASHVPVYLTHKSGHAAWANSAAMRAAGITADTPDPAGGKVARDAQGRPTGIFYETAMELVAAHVPEPSRAEIVEAMRLGQEACWRAGLTGVHDFDGRESFVALQTLHRNHELGLRVVKNIPAYRAEHASGVGLQTGFGDEWLRIGGVKIFADGALGPRTAAMLQPYESEPDNHGITVTDKEEMVAITSRASANGLSVTIHAIGDRANHDVLDVYEVVREEEAGRGQSPNTLRHRIEHVQLIHPQDIPRLAELNVIASMQPVHATADRDMADSYWGDRARYSYAWRKLEQAGATLVFGSDAPIESIAPLPGIYAAITRARPGEDPATASWYPEERLTLNEAVRGFTLAAAITSGQEDRLGRLSAGNLADLTIFDRDIYETPVAEFSQVEIAGTIVGGKFRYRTW